jgi:hypothetical protein
MPLLPTTHSLGTTCLSCQGLKLRFDRFLGLVIIGFIEVSELVGKTTNWRNLVTVKIISLTLLIENAVNKEIPVYDSLLHNNRLSNCLYKYKVKPQMIDISISYGQFYKTVDNQGGIFNKFQYQHKHGVFY